MKFYKTWTTFEDFSGSTFPHVNCFLTIFLSGSSFLLSATQIFNNYHFDVNFNVYTYYLLGCKP